MKAFLLAAGLGTRLRPITYETPKCLVDIGGKPLVQYWMELFKKHGIDEVLMNTSYLADSVKAFFDDYERKEKFPKVTFTYEEKLLGSAGTIRENKEFATGDYFLICYADNLTNIDLGKLIETHIKGGKTLTMALFRAGNPKECGIATLDENGIITDFIEKPEEPKDNLANAGMYIVNKDIFKYISDTDFDFGKDVLPKLKGEMMGYIMNEYIIDIGTLEKYEKANRDVRDIRF